MRSLPVLTAELVALFVGLEEERVDTSGSDVCGTQQAASREARHEAGVRKGENTVALRALDVDKGKRTARHMVREVSQGCCDFLLKYRTVCVDVAMIVAPFCPFACDHRLIN